MEKRGTFSENIRIYCGTWRREGYSAKTYVYIVESGEERDIQRKHTYILWYFGELSAYFDRNHFTFILWKVEKRGTFSENIRIYCGKWRREGYSAKTYVYIVVSGEERDIQRKHTYILW